MEILRKLKNFIDEYTPALREGQVVEIKENTILVRLFSKKDKNKEVGYLSDTLLLNSSELSFTPKVGSKVIIGYLNGKFDEPIILGALDSYNKDKISLNENIVVNKVNGDILIKGRNINLETTGKISIKNTSTNIGEIITKTLESLIKHGVQLTSNAPFPIANTLIADLTEIYIKATLLFETQNVSLSNVDTKLVEDIKAKAREGYEDMVKKHKEELEKIENSLSDDEKEKRKNKRKKMIEEMLN